MGLFSKIANVATGGLLGMAKGAAKGDLKAIASGGMLGSRPGMPGGQPVAASPEAQAMLAAMSPEDQANVLAGAKGHTLGGGAGLNDWYNAARAAGAPAPQMGGAPPAAAAALAMQGMGMAPAAPAAPAPTDYKALAAKQAEQKARRAAWQAKAAGTPAPGGPVVANPTGPVAVPPKKGGPKGPRGGVPPRTLQSKFGTGEEMIP